MRSGTLYRSNLFARLGVRAHGERVLDIGSFDSYWLTRQPGTLKLGIDLDIQANPHCHTIRGDAQRLPLPSDSFDSVFAFEVIEHVEDDERFLSELVRVTRPGGTITISTPSEDLRIFPPQLTPWAHRRWGHVRCTGYSDQHLRDLLSAAGATDVDVRPLSTWSLRALYLPLSALARASGRAAELAFGACAYVDSTFRANGKHGYLLATATPKSG